MARCSLCSPVALAVWIAVLACAPIVAVSADAPLSPELTRLILMPTTKIATVGDQTILAGDVLPTIDQSLKIDRSELPSHQLAQLDQQRAQYVRQLLPRKIEVKLVLVDFKRTIPADKLKDVLANIDKQVEEQFYDQQIPALMEQMEVESIRDLETKLRSFSTSINSQKEEFRDQMIARTMIGQTIDKSPEITHEDLLEYYYEHSKDYQHAARARWEKLTVRFDKIPDRAAAQRAIAEMGNQVLRGADFASVARQHSQGVNAQDGGRHEWTSKGALVSTVLDQAIFSLPLNRLSTILQDDTGFHIVRVLERQEAYQDSFEDAQQEIREVLQEQHRQRQVKEYLEDLREKTFIWTIFDDAP